MTLKVLGQSSPAAATPANVYTVGAGLSTVISTVSICNQNATAVTYRISVRPAGAAQATQHYVVFDALLPALSTDFLTIGIALSATDVVTVQASATGVSFSLFGNES